MANVANLIFFEPIQLTASTPVSVPNQTGIKIEYRQQPYNAAPSTAPEP